MSLFCILPPHLLTADELAEVTEQLSKNGIELIVGETGQVDRVQILIDNLIHAEPIPVPGPAVRPYGPARKGKGGKVRKW